MGVRGDIAPYFPSARVSLVAGLKRFQCSFCLTCYVPFVDLWLHLKWPGMWFFCRMWLIIETNGSIPWQLRIWKYRPCIKHCRSIMPSGSFMWSNWLNSQSNWQSLCYDISFKPPRRSTWALYSLAQLGLQGRAVKIHKMCFCKALPDIHLSRFQGLEGLSCQTLTLLPSF